MLIAAISGLVSGQPLFRFRNAVEAIPQPIQQAKKLHAFLGGKSPKCCLIIGANGRPPRDPLARPVVRQAHMPKPPISPGAEPFHQARRHEPIYHCGQVLPAKHQEGDQFLDRQPRFPAARARQSPHDSPLLRGGAKRGDRPCAGFVHEVRGLIKPEKKPVCHVKPRRVIVAGRLGRKDCNGTLHQ